MGMIPPDTIEQVAAANDIVGVIGSYFPVRRAGSVFKALCPFHNEKTPSFHINPARQSYHCFGCGVGGSVFRFVMAYENLDFVSAVKRLADRAGIPIVEEQMSPEDDARLRLRKRLLELHKEAAEWFHRNLMRTPAGARAREYLKSRELTGEVAANWLLGYAPDSWEAFGSFAESRGFTRDEISRSGLVSTREEGEADYYDRFRDRLMFPIRNDYGEVIAFSGRVLESAASGENLGAKYVNSPETMLFVKGNVLFGLHASKRDLINAKTAIVCEGQIDLISAFEAGVRNVVAPQGTAFTERQASMLKRFVENVVLCFDSDAAGEKAAERSLAALLDQGLLVRVATMPPGEDPDSLIRGQGAEAFQEIIDAAPGFFDFQIARLSGDADVRARQQFARRMAEFIALVKDPVIREDAISKTVSRIGILREDFAKMIPKNRPLASDQSGMEVEEDLPFEPPTVFLERMCLFAIRDSLFRKKLAGQDWLALLEGEPGAELLGKIVQYESGASQGEAQGNFASFLSGLSESEEAYVTRLLNDRIQIEPGYTSREARKTLRDARGRGENKIEVIPDSAVDQTIALKAWKDFCLHKINRQLKRTKQELIAAVAAGQELVEWQTQQKELLGLKKTFEEITMEPASSEPQKQPKEFLDQKNVLMDIPQPSEPTEDPF